MGNNERLRMRVEGALLRAAEKVGVDCYVVFDGSVFCVRGVFLPGGDAGNVVVGSVGDRGRFLFAASVWAKIDALVGDSLDFTIQYAGDEWAPEMGAPVSVDPVAGITTVACYRVLLKR